ncbi:hypothetical protein ARSEF4850_008511 [Beauveria asiatica]
MPFRRPQSGVTETLRCYIGNELKHKFNLDDQPGSKPVLSVDDLLLGLTHHWSRDRGVFPTEDDRLDLPAIMLFQAYTACRPAELVDGTKCRGASDPMLDDSDIEDAGSSERAADDVVVARGGKSLSRKSGTSNRRMNQKWKPTIKPGYDYEPEPESGSDAGSSLDDSLHDPVFDSDGESGDGESDDDGDGDETSDTEYGHNENEDVNMLPPESDPG